MTETSQFKRLAINTGGGDAPGLNAVIRAVVLAARHRGWDVWGIRSGYDGLMGMEDGLVPMDEKSVRGLTHRGGTILGTSNRGNPFRMVDADGQEHDRSAQVMETFREEGFDALVAIGGDGSLSIARRLHEEYGLPVVGVPKTIDNDLLCTDVTFGFDTAVATATDALGKLHSTAESHQRVMVVELMGRYAGWIALHAGLAGTADVILIPEIPFSMECVNAKIREREESGQRFSIVVVAEGATPVGGGLAIKDSGAPGGNVRLGGIGEEVAAAIAESTGKETRTLVLGHLQRGGQPSAFDRLLCLRLGAAAVRMIERGEVGRMVTYNGIGVGSTSLAAATERVRKVPLDSDTVQTARDLGVCLGD